MRRAARSRRAVLLALLAITALKLWLVAAQPLYACSSFPDDVTFLRLGDSIASRQWLGRYDQYTLIKGPIYPLFIASVHASGLPLLLARCCTPVARCSAGSCG